MFDWLMTTELAYYIGSNAWTQQALETLHMTAFSAMIGAIAVLDLRLLGLGRRLPIDAYAPLVNWIAWIAMTVLVVSGLLMFMPRAESISARWAFQLKMGLLVLALANLAYIQTRVGRLAGTGGAFSPVPGGIKAMAAISLLLWVTIIIVARFMYAIDQMAGGVR